MNPEDTSSAASSSGRAARPWSAPDPSFDCLVVTDGYGLIRDASPSAAVLLRCPREFVLGKPFPLFAVNGSRARFYRVLARLSHGVTSDAFEARLARHGEEPRDVSVFVFTSNWSADVPARTCHWQLHDVTERKRSEAVRADLLRRLSTAQEDERRRVARELHDSFGQLLTALALASHAARQSDPLPPAAAARLDEVNRLVGELSRAAHDLAVRLRPTALDDLGLHAALAQLVAGWSAHTGVAADFLPVNIEGARFPPEVETAVYRVVQESLTNVARHARAGRVSVVVGRQNGSLIVAVEDDGVGFDPEAARAADRLGLLGMKERMQLAGGWLEVESSPGNGTTVLARLPLPA